MGNIVSRSTNLATIERELDGEVYRLYGISKEDRQAIELELAHSLPPDDDGPDSTPPDSGAEAKVSGTLNRQELAELRISYAFGIIMGRFQIGVEGRLGRGCFSERVNEELRSLVSDDVIVVLDVGRPRNLANRVEQALDLMLGENQTQDVISEATGGKSLVTYLERDFFKQHVQRYRKRPVYWLLQSAKRSYGLYLFHERITKDTLYVIQGSQYLGSKIAQVSAQVEELHARVQRLPQGRERKQAEKDLDEAGTLLSELEGFAQALKAVTSATNERGDAVGWDLEIDDGVLINLAPLFPLMPAWSSEPKKCWESLRKGDYDWSLTAMRYWPDRVLSKCRMNKSYAIAHGRLDVYG